MKNLFIILIVLLVTVTAVSFFFLGLSYGQKKAKLIYVPTKGLSSSLPIKGSLNATTGGIVKNITDTALTIGNTGNNEATFNLSKDLIVFAKKNDNIESTQSGKTKINIFTPQEKVSVSKVQTGQTVSLQLSIVQSEITVKEIHIVNNEK